MASIRKQIHIDAPVAKVWEALRDVGALHTRLVPGFVTDTRMDGNARIVTFGNGMVAREEIVSVDEQHAPRGWAILDAPFDHYNGVAWVEPEVDGGTRFTWTADLLPNELAGQVDAMMSAGIQVIKKTLERPPNPSGPCLQHAAPDSGFRHIGHMTQTHSNFRVESCWRCWPPALPSVAHAVACADTSRIGTGCSAIGTCGTCA